VRTPTNGVRPRRRMPYIDGMMSGSRLGGCNGIYGRVLGNTRAGTLSSQAVDLTDRGAAYRSPDRDSSPAISDDATKRPSLYTRRVFDGVPSASDPADPRVLSELNYVPAVTASSVQLQHRRSDGRPFAGRWVRIRPTTRVVGIYVLRWSGGDGRAYKRHARVRFRTYDGRRLRD